MAAYDTDLSKDDADQLGIEDSGPALLTEQSYAVSILCYADGIREG